MQVFTVPIWEPEEYSYKTGTDFIPTLTCHILDGVRPKRTILICPGGAYRRTVPTEADVVALKFMQEGYCAFILAYTVRHDDDMEPVSTQALKDASRAMAMIRENADEWRINPNQIAICGFSAGGHLAASLAVHWDKEFLRDIRGVGSAGNKPNAAVLCYPVISMGVFRHDVSFRSLLGDMANDDEIQFMSLETQVTGSTPPTFIWHTREDTSVPPENSMMFADALQKNNIVFELHIFPFGSHGTSTSDRQWAEQGFDIYRSPVFELNRKLAEKEIKTRAGKLVDFEDLSNINTVDEYCARLCEQRPPCNTDTAAFRHNAKWVGLCVEFLEMVLND